jgi:PAS domain S-box-containing protein
VDPRRSVRRAAVLVIDDDPTMCDALGTVLRAHGHTVASAGLGAQGLAVARSQRFDVAIVDIRLPDMSGLELLAGLRAVAPAPEVVLVTGHGSLTTALEAMRRDAFGYLLKPFEPDLLLATVERALEKRRLVRALQEAEEHHRLITEHIDDALFLLDPEATLTYVSRSAEILTGYSEVELLSRPFALLFEPHSAAEIVARLLAVGDAAGASARVDARLLRKDGTPIWVEWTATTVVQGGRPTGLLAVARDVSERKRAEEIARALADAGRELVGTLEPAEVARRIVDAVIRLFDGRRSALFQLEPASGELVVLASGGADEPERWVGRRFPAGTTVASRAIEEGRPVWSADVLAEYGQHLGTELRADLEEMALGAVLAVPVLARGRTLGALALGDAAGRRFGEEEGRLLAAFAGHAAIALENARLFAELRAGRDQLEALSRRLVEVQETERRHLARELHDEIGQGLTGLGLTLEMSARGRSDEARAHLADAQGLVGELMARVRQLSLDLRPAMLDDLGLLPALQWLFERYTTQTGIAVAFRHSGFERLPPDVETAVFRVVQEALTNVARHARVQEVAVRLVAAAHRLWLEVEDRGVGFDADAGLGGPSTGGLLGMRERVSLLGGRLSLTSAPGRGTHLTADLPLASPAAGGAAEYGR